MKKIIYFSIFLFALHSTCVAQTIYIKIDKKLLFKSEMLIISSTDNVLTNMQPSFSDTIKFTKENSFYNC